MFIKCSYVAQQSVANNYQKYLQLREENQKTMGILILKYNSDIK